MLELLAKPTIIEVAEEVEPDVGGLLEIKAIAKVLPTATMMQMGKVVGEAIDEVAEQVVGEASISACEVTTTLAMASPKAGCMAGLLLVVTMDSSNASWLFSLCYLDA